VTAWLTHRHGQGEGASRTGTVSDGTGCTRRSLDARLPACDKQTPSATRGKAVPNDNVCNPAVADKWSSSRGPLCGAGVGALHGAVAMWTARGAATLRKKNEKLHEMFAKAQRLLCCVAKKLACV
jgi:hypothetical protein